MPLNTDAEPDELNDTGLQLSVAANGRLIATWARGPSRLLVLATSDDAGLTWSDPRILIPDGASRGPYFHASDAAGRIVVSWREQSAATDSLLTLLSADNGQTWSAPRLVPQAIGTSLRITNPRIAADSLGSFIITTLRDSQPVGLRSIDGGLTWAAPRAFGTVIPDDVTNTTAYGPVVAAARRDAASSSWVVAWVSYTADNQFGIDRDLFYSAFRIDDCDSNGRADAIDIRDFSAPDCNHNAIPDSCDIAAGRAADCDGDGQLDACELAAGAPDINRDGVPDACQCLADVNNDGHPSLDDLFAFLQGYFGLTPVGDFNHDHAWTVEDIFGYLAAFFSGCP